MSRLAAALLLLPAVCLAQSAWCAAAESDAEPAADPGAAPAGGGDPNADVLRIARGYDDGGGYNRTWKGSGVPEELRFGGERILAAGDGTYCCGLTFAVALRAAEQRGLLQGRTAEEIRHFRKDWYGVNDDSKETLCTFAVERLGVGHVVKHHDALPGDFVQFWRTSGSGHSVIFLGWVKDQPGAPVGLRYRSSQGSTDGVGDRTEFFSDTDREGARVLRERTYFCRLAPPAGP